MKQPALFALACSAFVLYLAVSAVAAGVRLSGGVLFVAAVSLWSALIPLWFRRGEPDHAPGQVGALGCLAALCLGAQLAVSARSLLGELVLALGAPLLGFQVLQLAFFVPDLPPRLARHQGSRPLLQVAAGLAIALGVAAVVPPVPAFGRVWIAPHWLSYVKLGFLAAALVLALGLRLFRRRLGSGAQALSANLWALWGSGAALLVALFTLGLRVRAGLAAGEALAGFAAATALLLLGHLWLASPGRVRVASRWLRELFAGLAALVLALSAWWWVERAAPDGAARIALFAACLLLFELARQAARRMALRLLAPHGGNLLRAIDRARVDVGGARDFTELSERLLRPLRRAAGSPEAAPLLCVFDPVREVRLDAAGFGRVESRPLPAVIFHKLQEAAGAPLVRAEIAARLSRRPELRALLVALDELSALCVVPIMTEGNLEGALVLAQGARREALSLEELIALEGLIGFVTPLLSTLLMVERANARFAEVDRERRGLAERAAELAGELARVRAREKLLSSARGQFAARRVPIQYSAAMRELVARLGQVASHDVPILLLGESGVAFEPLAELVHREGGRQDGPFVVGSPVDLPAESQLAELVGDEGQGHAPAGWLRLAAGGTLLLRDLAALHLDAQRALVLALSERRARPLGSATSYPLEARIVATSERPLTELVERKSLLPELARWFEPTTYPVPSLRERREDVESLVLLAIDRAARALGRPAPGIEPEAMALLVEHDWPGNLVELESVVARAVLRAEGPRVRVDDLPALARGASANGSFFAQEREILRRALERAGGNRTRAARVLGLKRTTLLDKLRRHGLDAPRAQH